MRSVVIFGAQPGATAGPSLPVVTVDGIAVRCGLVIAPDRTLERVADEHADRVLVRVRAFSCNYRDRAFFNAMQRVPPHRFTPIGSEFVGTVVAVGDAVSDLRPGDRVIPTHHYTGYTGCALPNNVRGGVITNQASRELQVVPRVKLKRIPDAMPDDVAATFSLNAQTAYSIVRRLRLHDGARVLVLSASAGVSLAVIAALRAHGATTYAVTCSAHILPALRALGVLETLVLDRDASPFRTSPDVDVFARACGGIDAIVDPFFDLHVERAVEILEPFGHYVTCGLAGQNEYSRQSASVVEPIDGTRVLMLSVLKNLSIIGNCLGVDADLDAAIADYAAGRFTVPVDSVFTGDAVVPYLTRTFNDRHRTGRVAYQYTG